MSDEPSAAGFRERYFRGIADRFIALRGAPFSLSPADICLIEAWESAGIPLETVLEGLEAAFALRPGRGRAPGKIRTLSFCRAAVERALERSRERDVGRRSPELETRSTEKIKKARTAVDEFLSRRPAGFAALLPEFEKARSLLKAKRPDDEALERLDGKIDAWIRDSAGPARLGDAEAAVDRDHPGLRGPEKESAARIRLVRNLREKHRIPYVSLYYY